MARVVADGFSIKARTEILDAIGIVVGSYQIVQSDLSGAQEPDPEIYLKLTEDDSFNDGKLADEQSSGEGPLREVTAEVIDEDSPLFGQRIHLLNSERRYTQPGDSPGTVANDVMQQITASTTGNNFQIIGAQNISGVGAFSFRNQNNGRFSGGGNGAGYTMDFDSADSPDARTSDHTAPKHIEATYYMRYK